MIGRKNKGPSLAIATPALGGANGIVGAVLGGGLGYLFGSFEPLGGIILSALTGVVGSALTSVGSLGTSFASWPVNSFLDSLSSSGVTSLPLTPSSNLLLGPFMSISSIIPSF